jgi:CRP-like cAMP-binding protein
MLSDDATLLRKIPMFSGVDVAKLKLLVLAAERNVYAADDVIIRQGEKSAFVGIILDGEVEVCRETDGASVSLARLVTGAIVGEIGVVLEVPTSSTVIARSTVAILEIDKGVFLELLQQIPQLALALIRELARRLVLTSDLYAEALARR